VLNKLFLHPVCLSGKTKTLHQQFEEKPCGNAWLFHFSENPLSVFCWYSVKEHAQVGTFFHIADTSISMGKNLIEKMVKHVQRCV
jgi:hypothetical protein